MSGRLLLGEPFARGYMEAESCIPILRIANGLWRAWQEAPISVSPDEMIVGGPCPRSIVSYTFGGGLECDRGLAARLLAADIPAGEKDRIREILHYFGGKTTGELIGCQYTEAERAAAGENVYWAGGWGGHIVLDYDRILRLGTSGLRELIDQYDTGDDTGSQFYQAMRLTCDMLEAIAGRYRDCCLKVATQLEPGDERAARLSEAARVLERVPRKPARSWHEAVQCFWLVFVVDGIDSPGRFDQYMIPYWRAAMEGGERSLSQARALLAELWRKFEEVRAWNLCIGGQKPDGTDASNELSMEILHLAATNYQIAPNLTMRCHPGTPVQLWQKAAEAVSTGVGMPAFYNDEVVIDALVDYGIPLTDARDYCMNGCNQIDIQGKSHMGLEDGEINLLKCLELALHNGVDPLTGRRIGPATGVAEEFSCFSELLIALKTQISFFVGELTRVANRSQRVYAETAPGPLRSLLTQGCLESGIDVKSGGALYNHGQVLIQGIGNTADALAALQNIVYEERRVKLTEVLGALAADWQGHDTLRRMLITRAPKYGNDDDEVDQLAAHIVDFTTAELKKHRTYRGGYYGGGSSVFVRGISFGSNVGATPDGRYARSPLADSVGPVQGRDRKGPTAVFNSVAKVNHRQVISGYVLNMRFSHQLLRDGGLERMTQAIQAFFASGGQQVQINVVDTSALLEAQKDPSSHQNLIVRVGGYSDYFVNLPKALQDEIISRTVQP